MGEVVGVSGHGRGLPETDVSEDGRGGNKVTSNGSEVKRGDGEDETLERSVLGSAAEKQKKTSSVQFLRKEGKHE